MKIVLLIILLLLAVSTMLVCMGLFLSIYEDFGDEIREILEKRSREKEENQ